MNSSLLYPVFSASRRVVSLDGMWKFQFDPTRYLRVTVCPPPF